MRQLDRFAALPDRTRRYIDAHSMTRISLTLVFRPGSEAEGRKHALLEAVAIDGLLNQVVDFRSATAITHCASTWIKEVFEYASARRTERPHVCKVARISRRRPGSSATSAAPFAPCRILVDIGSLHRRWRIKTQFQTVRNHEDGLRLEVALEYRETDRLLATDEQSARQIATVLNDPSSATVLPDEKCRV